MRDPTLQQQLDQWFSRAARSAPGGVGGRGRRQQGSAGLERQRHPAPDSRLDGQALHHRLRPVRPRAVRPASRPGSSAPDRSIRPGPGSGPGPSRSTATRPSSVRSGPVRCCYDLAAQLADRGIRRLTGPLAVQSAHGIADATWPSVWASPAQGKPVRPAYRRADAQRKPAELHARARSEGAAAGRGALGTRRDQRPGRDQGAHHQGPPQPASDPAAADRPLRR